MKWLTSGHHPWEKEERGGKRMMKCDQIDLWEAQWVEVYDKIPSAALINLAVEVHATMFFVCHTK